MAGEDELIKFILSSKEKKRTEEQIVRALLSVGWKKEKIEAAFRTLREQEFISQQDQITAESEAEARELESQNKADEQARKKQPVPVAQPSPSTRQPGQIPPQAQPAFPAQPKKSAFSFPNIFGKKQAPQQSVPVPQTTAPPVAQQTIPSLQNQSAFQSQQLPSSQSTQPPPQYSTSPKPPQLAAKPPVIPQAQFPSSSAQPQTQKQPFPQVPFSKPPANLAMPLQQPPAIQTAQQKTPSLQGEKQAASQQQSISPQQEKQKPYLKPMWPEEIAGDSLGPLPPGITPRGSVDESSVKNPAFSKIESAAVKPEKKNLALIAIIAILFIAVLGAVYFVFIAGTTTPDAASVVPFQPAGAPQGQGGAAAIENQTNASQQAGIIAANPPANATQLENQSAASDENATAQNDSPPQQSNSALPNSQNNSPAPFSQPQTMPPATDNSSSSLQPPANDSSSQQNTSPVQPAQNPPETSVQPKPQTIPVTFVPEEKEAPQERAIVRKRDYQSTSGTELSKFCQSQNNGTLLSLHYREFWGTDCVTEKNKDGIANASALPKSCSFLPCCENAQSHESSRKYDYITCGFYE